MSSFLNFIFFFLIINKMSYTNMNSKYRSVEDTVVSKNVLSELGLPEITNKLRVVSGTANLTGVAFGTPTPFLGPDERPIAIPAGSFVEKIVLRYDGSSVGLTPLATSASGTIGLGVATLGLNGTISGYGPFTNGSPTGIEPGTVNVGNVYHVEYMTAYNVNNLVLATQPAVGAITGTMRANFYITLM
jgi:hypothetical protein